MNRVKVHGMGPADAKILIVGEAPGKDEVESLMPFQGAAGIELTKLLAGAGINRGECRITNVCKYQPPKNKMEFWLKAPTKTRLAQPNELVLEGIKELEQEIANVQPELIILLGNTALWAVTNNWGVGKWGGSIIWSKEILGKRFRTLPTYHPAAILRRYDWRYITSCDLLRGRRYLAGEITEPDYHFTPAPTFLEAQETLQRLISRGGKWLASDIETHQRHLDCIGFAWSPTEAICIPFIDRRKENKHYWSLEEELVLIKLIRELLLTARIIGQNWPYDAQYIAKYWLCEPNLQWDTMTQHHVMYAGMEKALHYLARLYLDWYEYWKDERKEANTKQDPILGWTYNCKDCVATYEVAMKQMELMPVMHFKETEFGTPSSIQQSLHEPVMKAILRGVAVDKKLKLDLIMEFTDLIEFRQKWVEDIVGRPLNFNSPKQLKELFYDELRQPIIYNYKDGRSYPSCDAAALDRIGKRMPGLAPICQTINESRELGNARAFCGQELDSDSRIRSSYVIPGTETFRFASKKDAFGFGANLQNITEGYEADTPDGFSIPNLRRTFIPDSRYTIGDFDLESADAQIVAMEAGSSRLLRLFRDPDSNLHDENAKRWEVPRPVAKGSVHAVDYDASAYALSQADFPGTSYKLTKAKGQAIIDDWLGVQAPEIKDWQDRILEQIMTRKYVENAFGYRRYYFGRIEGILKEALAWIPQSSVAIVTNLGIRNVYNSFYPTVQLLLQVHDSAVYQWPSAFTKNIVPQIISCMEIPVPYPDPLTIGVGAKLSTKSWGEVG